MDVMINYTYEERLAWGLLQGKINWPIDFSGLNIVDARTPFRYYVLCGIQPGSCFRCLIIGDLHGAFQRMHPNLKNSASINIIATWFYENAPEQCYGSEAKYDYWIKNGGIYGLEKNGKKVHLKCDY